MDGFFLERIILLPAAESVPSTDSCGDESNLSNVIESFVSTNSETASIYQGSKFFHVPNLHTSARSIDSNLHTEEK